MKVLANFRFPTIKEIGADESVHPYLKCLYALNEKESLTF